MAEPPTAGPTGVRPILVYRTKSALWSLKEVVRSPSVREQFARAGDWAAATNRELRLPAHLVVRTAARYQPQKDRQLLRAIEEARRSGVILAIDDVFRLIDVRSSKAPLSDISELIGLRSTIFSLDHGCFFSKMTVEMIRRELASRMRQSKLRSEEVKAGIERSVIAEERSNLKAAKAGGAARRAMAEARARYLVDVIAAVRAGLEPRLRENLAAIAAALNHAGEPTPSGRGRWQGTTVKRVLNRAGHEL